MTAVKARELLIKRRWEPGEDDLLRDHYPGGDLEELLAMMPGRTAVTMKGRASQLGLRRNVNLGNTGKVVSPVIVRNGVQGKACQGPCREWRPLEKFARHATCAGGRRNTCTTCEGRQAHARNPKARIAAMVRYQKRNPEKYRLVKMAAQRRRHGRKIVGVGITAGDARLLFWLYGGFCAYCKEESADTLDHVTPLSRGGLHEFGNLLPACAGCNFAKHTMTLEEWVACGMRGRSGA